MHTIKFIDSYGQKRAFPRTAKALLGLRKRHPEHVLSEVLELLERVSGRTMPNRTPVVKSEDISLELNVHPKTIKKVFEGLESRGLIEAIENTREHLLVREVQHEDYENFKE